MKKLLSVTMAAALCAAAVAGFSACNDNEVKEYDVYAPDGAPALSLVNAIGKEDKRFDYHVISSATINAQVTGENPAADFCVLPLNLASKLLGTGETYQMLGTVTNGNIYFLTQNENPALTSANLSEALLGKTVGAVQLANVPGLTLQAVLADHNIPYQVISSVSADKAADKVNLLNLGMDATNVTPAFGCDYYLCPEPAATAKIKGTQQKLFLAGDLQELYGENGYPQAVLVAKKSVISSDKKAVEALISYFEGSAEYLGTVTPATVLSALEGVRTNGLDPAFKQANLTQEVIANCSVRYTPAKDCKATVNAFLEKLIAIKADSASAVSDAFYYGV